MESKLEAVWSIAVNTFRELVRGKVLYTTLFFAIVVILVSSLFGSVTIGDQILVIKDFGLFSISIFATAFAVIAGASLLHKELSLKTVFNILAKPVHRWQFLAGKFAGMFMTVLLMTFIMSTLLSLFVFSFEHRFDFSLLLCYPYIALEMIIVCAAAIFFSSMVVTPALSGLFTFGFFLAGRSVEYVLYFVREGSVSGLIESILKTLYYILPHLSVLNANLLETQNHLISTDIIRLAWSLLYSVSYACILISAATLIFKRREFF